MGEFERMMDRLHRGLFDKDIEEGYERSGIVTPAMLQHLSANANTTVSEAMIEAVGQTLVQMDSQIHQNLLSSPDLTTLAAEIIGRPLPYGKGCFELRDLVKVLMRWRVEVIGSRLTVMAWYTIKGGLTPDAGSGYQIVWPAKDDKEAALWPPRLLQEAFNCAAFTASLRKKIPTDR